MEETTRKITAIERTTAAIHAIHPAASNYLGEGAYNVAGAGSFNMGCLKNCGNYGEVKSITFKISGEPTTASNRYCVKHVNATKNYHRTTNPDCTLAEYVEKAKLSCQKTVWAQKFLSGENDPRLCFFMMHSITNETSLYTIMHQANHDLCEDYSEQVIFYNLPFAQKFEAFLDLFEELALLHSTGYCHGDIKPENIMVVLNTDGSFRKLTFIDFDGIAPAGDNCHITQQYTPARDATAQIAKFENDLYAMQKVMTLFFTEELQWQGTFSPKAIAEKEIILSAISAEQWQDINGSEFNYANYVTKLDTLKLKAKESAPEKFVKFVDLLSTQVNGLAGTFKSNKKISYTILARINHEFKKFTNPFSHSKPSKRQPTDDEQAPSPHELFGSGEQETSQPKLPRVDAQASSPHQLFGSDEQTTSQPKLSSVDAQASSPHRLFGSDEQTTSQPKLSSVDAQASSPHRLFGKDGQKSTATRSPGKDMSNRI